MQLRLPRIEVDFNYGGIDHGVGIVYLSQKSGDPRTLQPYISAQLQSQGRILVAGEKILLADIDRSFQDLVGTILWDEHYGWFVEYAASDVVE
jgi:hypothetical protein